MGGGLPPINFYSISINLFILLNEIITSSCTFLVSGERFFDKLSTTFKDKHNFNPKDIDRGIISKRFGYSTLSADSLYHGYLIDLIFKRSSDPQ